ncbi:MAG: hypothetical protein OEO18_00165 [Gammaproteobacteria bacterium]|nr:hypothetical protein [Gammaproteobacteria bacterium]
MHLPSVLERPITRPVTSVSDSAAGFRDASRQQPSTRVYRGELLDTVTDRSYRPEPNLQISPQNRRAISTYRNTANPQPIIGRILNGYI